MAIAREFILPVNPLSVQRFDCGCTRGFELRIQRRYLTLSLVRSRVVPVRLLPLYFRRTNVRNGMEGLWRGSTDLIEIEVNWLNQEKGLVMRRVICGIVTGSLFLEKLVIEVSS